MAGWDLHPQKNAALPRRTPITDVDRDNIEIAVAGEGTLDGEITIRWEK